MRKGEKVIDGEWGEFCVVFGATPRNRIIEFFLIGQGLDYGIGDVAELTGLNRATAYNTMDELIREEIIIPTRNVGRTQLYTLNLKKQSVQLMRESFNLILQSIAKGKPLEI